MYSNTLGSHQLRTTAAVGVVERQPLLRDAAEHLLLIVERVFSANG